MKPHVLLESAELYTNNGRKEVVKANEVLLDCNEKRTYNKVTEKKVMTIKGHVRWIEEQKWKALVKPADSYVNKT